MATIILVVGVALAIAILAAAFQPQSQGLKGPGIVLASIVLIGAILLSSIRHINAEEVGIVVKNVGTKSLQGGAYIAVNGEQGIQAGVLTPGWHLFYWPFIYDVREVPLTVVESGMVGIIETTDGRSLDADQVIAPEFPAGQEQQMLDAKYFLTDGQGRKGTQASVLRPGKYRLNTELYKIKPVEMTEIKAGEVGVLKANFGTRPSIPAQVITHSPPGAPAGPAPGAASAPGEGANPSDGSDLLLAGPGQMGIRAEVLPPGKYAINTNAYTVTEIWSTQMIAHYTKGGASIMSSKAPVDQTVASQEERELTVRTSDGFTFPVDVRIEYVIDPRNAPIVVSKLGDDEGERFKNALNSVVRAVFRNNAERVRALDYVQQRSIQESQSLKMLVEEMAKYGVTITAVRIGNVGDEQTLGALLKTQTDREIAKQELLTSVEQQKAAEQKKQLARTTQESEEEKRLATATYQVKIAEQSQKQRLVEAEAEAQATKIKALAQADAYRQIAEQIGKSNAALIELFKIVGERNIQITPRVLITGGDGGSASGQNAALMGTILDTMVKDDPPTVAPAPRKP
jgi:regulator of protease activity HflC (stomatin/prohibitin superfamily)